MDTASCVCDPKNNSIKFHNVTHCIFDIDGLLLDTEPLYEEIIGTVTRRYGGEYTEEVRQLILGRREQETARIAIQHLNLKCTESQFTDDYIKLYMQELQKAQLMPGAERLIRHLHAHNIPMALATSSSSPSVAAKTKSHKELFSLFSHVVSGTSDPEVKESKPAPDIFLVCAARFPDKPEPNKCLVFEDAPAGVLAAVAAGMQVVMVPDSRISEEQRKEATIVLKSLEDFRPEIFGLPSF